MKALVVEDDFVGRRLLQAILSPYGPCHVAVNGSEAIKALRLSYDEGAPYDLVCLDIMMPDLDGHTVLKELNAIKDEYCQSNSDMPKVIMTTALGDKDNVFRAFREQCDAYMVKPIDKEYFLAKVKELELIPV